MQTDLLTFATVHIFNRGKEKKHISVFVFDTEMNCLHLRLEHYSMKIYLILDCGAAAFKLLPLFNATVFGFASTGK